ncbi:MAG: NAD(P)/FAD-dependent oxidoreductase [Clostridia bacterium]|nr:NAD(P)/FAD-dependent oxidoreductase [Clostridia bacterium]
MKVIIIGAGAAGLMAAYSAGKCGHEVVLIEKNDRFGKKLAITGKGRCNVTNDSSVDELIKNVPVNGRFLYSAFNAFSAYDTMEFFENAGVKLKTERGNRVFPVSDKAQDIVNALVSEMKKYNVKAIKGNVVRITTANGAASGVLLSDGKKISAERVIIATGGLSYPTTGSTGDGYKFAKELGHTVTEIKPSLVPLVTEESFPSEMMGLSLKNVAVTLYENGKKKYSDFGEMLFTHFGVSGPMILSASSHMKKDVKSYKIEIDLKPALDEAALDKRILRDFEKYAKRDFINSLSDLLPQKMIPVIVKLSGIDERKTVCEITKEERRNLCYILKHLTLNIKDFRPVSEAIITSGGIKISEINPSTMESKIIPGLFFAGEVIDVDAYTGGFNLQIAFSTGYMAGNNL